MNVTNLIRLYEVGARILRERLPIGFGKWDCGTFACLGGWYVRCHPGSVCITNIKQTHEHFGFASSGPWHELFGFCGNNAAMRPGHEAYAELERRMQYLAGLIRDAGGEVPNYTTKHPIPDSVLALFATRETEAVT